MFSQYNNHNFNDLSGSRSKNSIEIEEWSTSSVNNNMVSDNVNTDSFILNSFFGKPDNKTIIGSLFEEKKDIAFNSVADTSPEDNDLGYFTQPEQKEYDLNCVTEQLIDNTNELFPNDQINIICDGLSETDKIIIQPFTKLISNFKILEDTLMHQQKEIEMKVNDIQISIDQKITENTTMVRSHLITELRAEMLVELGDFASENSISIASCRKELTQILDHVILNQEIQDKQIEEMIIELRKNPLWENIKYYFNKYEKYLMVMGATTGVGFLCLLGYRYRPSELGISTNTSIITQQEFIPTTTTNTVIESYGSKFLGIENLFQKKVEYTSTTTGIENPFKKILGDD